MTLVMMQNSPLQLGNHRQINPFNYDKNNLQQQFCNPVQYRQTTQQNGWSHDQYLNNQLKPSFPYYNQHENQLFSFNNTIKQEAIVCKKEDNDHTISNSYHLHRLTPEIVEPRTSFFESESDLKKKIKPHLKNGVLQQLPSFKTFRDVVDERASSFQRLKQNNLVKLKTAKKPGRPIGGIKDNSTKFSCGCTVENPNPTPFYHHLGSARSKEELCEKLLTQFNVTKEAIRIVEISSAITEAKNGDGCPMARWVLRRTNETEKYLIAVKKSHGHTCEHQFTVVIIVAWEGIAKQYADDMYEYLRNQLNHSGYKTRRRCGSNESKTCMCQGEEEDTQGASFTFGCSWSMFFDGCKFSKSKSARKYKMQTFQQEEEMEKLLQDMSTNVSPLLNIWAPQAYENMTRYENVASDCRIGHNEGRPFSGVTCCLDFCAHSHKDLHNMNNGTTMVCTLLKPDYNSRDDEQLHVLPLYQLLDDEGNIATPNFDIPSHFMQSKIQSTQKQPEGKGRYVCPEAVFTVKKATESHKAADQNKGTMLDEKQNQVYPCYTDEKFIPLLKSDNTCVQQQRSTSYRDTNMLIKPLFKDDARVPVITSDWQNRNEEANNNSMEIQSSAVPSTNDIANTIKTRRNKPFVSQRTVITKNMGGVAVALGHGSFLVECARKELHATTALKNPQRDAPSRISMVFYQHKKLNKAKHGYDHYKEKMHAKKLEQSLTMKQSSLDDLSSLNDNSSVLNDSSLSNGTVDHDILESYKSNEESHSNSAPDIPSLFDDVKPVRPPHCSHDSLTPRKVDTPSNNGQSSCTQEHSMHAYKPFAGVHNGNSSSLTSHRKNKQTDGTSDKKLPTFSIFSSQFGEQVTNDNRCSNENLNNKPKLDFLNNSNFNVQEKSPFNIDVQNIKTDVQEITTNVRDIKTEVLEVKTEIQDVLIEKNSEHYPNFSQLSPYRKRDYPNNLPGDEVPKVFPKQIKTNLCSNKMNQSKSNTTISEDFSKLTANATPQYFSQSPSLVPRKNSQISSGVHSPINDHVLSSERFTQPIDSATKSLTNFTQVDSVNSNPLLILSNAAKDFSPSEYTIDTKFDFIKRPRKNSVITFGSTSNDTTSQQKPIMQPIIEPMKPILHKSYRKWNVASILEETNVMKSEKSFQPFHSSSSRHADFKNRVLSNRVLQNKIHQPTILDQHAAMFAGQTAADNIFQPQETNATRIAPDLKIPIAHSESSFMNLPKQRADKVVDRTVITNSKNISYYHSSHTSQYIDRNAAANFHQNHNRGQFISYADQYPSPNHVLVSSYDFSNTTTQPQTSYANPHNSYSNQTQRFNSQRHYPEYLSQLNTRLPSQVPNQGSFHPSFTPQHFGRSQNVTNTDARVLEQAYQDMNNASN